MKTEEDLAKEELELRCFHHYAYYTECTDNLFCYMVQECDGYDPGCKYYEPMQEHCLDYEAMLIQRLNLMREMNEKKR